MKKILLLIGTLIIISEEARWICLSNPELDWKFDCIEGIAVEIIEDQNMAESKKAVIPKYLFEETVKQYKWIRPKDHF